MSKVSDLREDLKKVLPAKHPVLKKLDEALVIPEINNILEECEHLVIVIDDWKRGIRSWDEVDDAVFKVRAEIETFKETR